MKKLIICISMMLAFGLVSNAQSVVREGNTFTQVTNKKSASKETKTTFTYKDSKGTEYPVYLSSTGKAFIKKTSKKTGREYRQYVPEIGRQINPEAYRKKEGRD